MNRPSPRLAALALLLAAPHAAMATTLIARGNEPGWRAVISETQITFSTPDAAAVTIAPVPKPVTAGGAATYAAEVGGKPFLLAVATTICVDTMSGMPFPKTATVTFGERSFKGCAGEPASLLHGEWTVAAIGEVPVLTGSGPTLSFDTEGRVSGNGSCNRYIGGFTLTGEGLTLSEAGATMMMCDQKLMEQEHRLLKAFASIRRFAVEGSGGLRLIGGDGRTVLSLRR